MKRILRASWLCCAALTTALAIAAPRVENIASLPAGTGGEALDEAADGSIYLTSNFDNKVLKIDPAGKVLAEYVLPIHTQVVLLTGDGGFVVTGHARLPDFAARKPGGPMPSFKGLGTTLLVVNRAGQVTKRLDGPTDSFFNGITQIGPSMYIVADTIGGTLWKADIARGTVEPWLTDVSVQGPDGKGSFGGSNGIKAHGGWIYYTSRGALWRSKIGAKGESGKPEQFARLGGDDFTVAKDGTIYLPAENDLMRISPQGEISKFAEIGANCPTAMLTRDGKSIFLLTRASFPGAAEPKPSRLVRVWLEG